MVTYTPFKALHGAKIEDDGNAEINVERYSGANIRIQSQASAGRIETTNSHELWLGANATGRIEIQSGGLVSIPGALTVSGTFNATLATAAQTNITSLGSLSSLDVNGDATVSGNLSLDGSNKELRFYEGSNYVGFEAPALSADQIWVLPAADGSANQALTTDGSGNFQWTSAGSIAGAGSNLSLANGTNNRIVTAVDGSNLNGEANLTFDGSTLTVAGNMLVNNNGSIKANGSGSLLLGNTNSGVIKVHGDTGSSIVEGYGNHLILQTVRDSDDIIFNVNAGGTDSDSTVVEAMRIHGPDANIGIGTTSPSTELHVSGADHPSIRVTGTDNDGADPAIELLGTADSFVEGGQLWYDNGTGVLHLASLYNNDAADIQFHTKTAADRSTSNVRMTIAGDGKVGINTTNPQQTLDIDGNFFLGKSGESTALTGSPQIFVQGDTAVATFTADNTSSGDQIAGIRVFGDSYRSIGMVIGDYNNSDGSVTEDWIFGRQYASGSKAGIFAAPENGGDEYITVNSDSQKAVKIAGDNDDIDFIIHGSSGEYFRAEASTGRVGIGTTSPSAPLHIYTTSTSEPSLLIENDEAQAPADAIIRLQSSGGSNTWIDFIQNTYGQLDITGGGSTRRQILTVDDPDTADACTISFNKEHFDWNTQIFGDSSTPAIFVEGGNSNVGIGTTSPARPLHVVGDIYAQTGDILLSRGNYYLQDASDATKRGSFSSDGVWAWENVNVGIGTTSPTASFDVSQGGAMTIIGGADLGATTRTNDTRKFFRMGMPHYHNAEEPFNLLCGDSSGTQNKVIIGGGTSAGNAATDILFNTGANDATTTGTTRMQIKSDGKVGIGTTSPETLLNVDNGTIQIGLQADSLYTQLSNNALMFHRAAASYIDQQVDNGDIRFRMNAANDDLMMLDGSTMRVGIGTTSPSNTLHVESADEKLALFKSTDAGAGIQIDSPDDGYSVVFFSEGGTDKWSLGKLASNSDRFSIYDEVNNTPRLVVGTDGKIGIGDSNPIALLHLEFSGGDTTTYANTNETYRNMILLRNNTVTTDAFAGIAFDVSTETDFDSIGASIAAVRDTSASSTAGNHDANLVFATNDAGDDGNTERMRITHDGNVGIGTTTPSSLLHVHGNMADGKQGILITRNDSSTVDTNLLGAIGFDSSDGNIPSKVTEASAGIAAYAAEDHGTGDKGGDLVFFTSPIDQDDDTDALERMRIDSEGKIGIGTNDPCDLVHIAGYGRVFTETAGYLDGNIFNSYSWSPMSDLTNPPAGFTINGGTDENSIVYGQTPLGSDDFYYARGLLWRFQDSGNSSASGGFLTATPYPKIDINKSYRMSVWVKRSHLTEGAYYMGFYGHDGPTGSNVGVQDVSRRGTCDGAITTTGTFTANFSSGSATLTNISINTNLLVTGMSLFDVADGTFDGIPDNTTIQSIDSSSQITMSANATATGTGRGVNYGKTSITLDSGHSLLDGNGSTTRYAVINNVDRISYTDIDNNVLTGIPLTGEYAISQAHADNAKIMQLETNAYFSSGDLPEVDKWYLVVGYVQGMGDTDYTDRGAVYDGETGNRVAGAGNFQWWSQSTYVRNRVYMFYSDDNPEQIQHAFDPRFEEISGAPQISTLLGGKITTGMTIKNDTSDITPTSGYVSLGEHGGALEINTASGYLRLGATSTSWNHIQGENAKFYFNKPLVIDGGNTSGSAYQISSYASEDLVLATQDGTENRITIKSDTGNVGIGVTAPSAKLEVAGEIKTSLGNINSCVSFVFNRSDMDTGAVNLKAVSHDYASSQNHWGFIMPKSGTVKYLTLNTRNHTVTGTSEQTWKINNNNDMSTSGEFFQIAVARGATQDNTGVSGNATMELTQSPHSSTIWRGAVVVNHTFDALDEIRIQRTNAGSTPVDMGDTTGVIYVEFD